MKLSQVQLLAEDAMFAENARQAALIVAVNLGSHGKKHDVERVLRDLTMQKKPQQQTKSEKPKMHVSELIEKLEREGKIKG